jgi:putative membrane protein
MRRQDLGNWGLAFYAASLAIAQSQPEVAPSEFMIRDARFCMAMIQVGQMAQKQAYSVEVAQFATKRIDEYSKMLDELKDIAAKAKVQLPTDLGLNSLNLLTELQASPNRETFDSYYITGMQSYLRDHLTEFQAQAQTSKDPGVKGFATKYIPTIRAAIDSADQLNEKVQNKSTTPRPKP